MPPEKDATKAARAERLLTRAYDDAQDAYDDISEFIHPEMRGKFYAWAHDANINLIKLRNLTKGDAYRRTP